MAAAALMAEEEGQTQRKGQPCTSKRRKLKSKRSSAAESSHEEHLQSMPESPLALMPAIEPATMPATVLATAPACSFAESPASESSGAAEERCTEEPARDGALSSTLVADEALQQAVGTGELEAIAAALVAHGGSASEEAVSQARTTRDRLKKRRSQRQRKAHAGAMNALSVVEALPSNADIEDVRSALCAAEKHARGELPTLDDAVCELRSRLATLELSAAESDATVSEPTAAAKGAVGLEVATVRNVALSLSELEAAMCGFGIERKIGSGGFADVFMGDTLASLPGVPRVAVKRAKPGLDPADLEREVAILRNSSHPHLLPLLGYSLESACLVFPLMVGGSLQSRLDLAPSDLTYLSRMGHLTARPVKVRRCAEIEARSNR